MMRNMRFVAATILVLFGTVPLLAGCQVTPGDGATIHSPEEHVTP